MPFNTLFSKIYPWWNFSTLTTTIKNNNNIIITTLGCNFYPAVAVVVLLCHSRESRDLSSSFVVSAPFMLTP